MCFNCAEVWIVVSLTHTAEVGHVLLGRLVLLVLIDPLVEVGLQELDLLRLLQQAGPVLLLKLLLAQLQLDIPGGVVDLAVLRVDLGPEVELDMVGALQRVGVAVEGQRRGLQVKLEAFLGDVRHGDGQVDKVLLGVGTGRALGPEHCFSRPSKKARVRSCSSTDSGTAEGNVVRRK